MNMKKKNIFVLLLALAMTLAACGGPAASGPAPSAVRHRGPVKVHEGGVGVHRQQGVGVEHLAVGLPEDNGIHQGRMETVAFCKKRKDGTL